MRTTPSHGESIVFDPHQLSSQPLPWHVHVRMGARGIRLGTDWHKQRKEERSWETGCELSDCRLKSIRVLHCNDIENLIGYRQLLRHIHCKLRGWWEGNYVLCSPRYLSRRTKQGARHVMRFHGNLTLLDNGLITN
jgi:hypothetical protein